MFPHINHIDDLLPHIAGKKEIALTPGPQGCTVVCYTCQDSGTFDTPWAAECRGIVFDRDGRVASRPLHKFFNIGEKTDLAMDALPWDQVTRVMDKRDGSMINTVHLDGELFLKSKKSFDNKQTRMAYEWLANHPHARSGLHALAARGYTATLELTSPANRIVVAYEGTEMRLLHVRNNVTGAYEDQLLRYLSMSWDIPLVDEADETTAACMARRVSNARELVEQLAGKTDVEGYVLQFADGSMVKAKTPWYSQLHRVVSFTRERDIAEAAAEERLDDIKAALEGMGLDIAAVNAVESRVKNILVAKQARVEEVLAEAKALDRKEFAVRFQKDPDFGLLMPAYLGKPLNWQDWFKKHVLKQEFGLHSLPGMPLSNDD
ncbi:RNA ligase [Ramlibacter alkalitolerans]|uniref:T4 RNA ligase 1-like N-terminal domain-containing protein n=1 Tax=Ramlibacter alkalitolerans TaxID=2039631 RepID=A0ABS1JUZ1_9BURK|nr:RNA ligase [Ramlibacter alkalitolerans]MBL0427696.1 hypothetical protein [Ramlibacter alkalitolerans]